jgi:outer membrane lipoprotein SlyB
MTSTKAKELAKRYMDKQASLRKEAYPTTVAGAPIVPQGDGPKGPMLGPGGVFKPEDESAPNMINDVTGALKRYVDGAGRFINKHVTPGINEAANWINTQGGQQDPLRMAGYGALGGGALGGMLGYLGGSTGTGTALGSIAGGLAGAAAPGLINAYKQATDAAPFDPGMTFYEEHIEPRFPGMYRDFIEPAGKLVEKAKPAGDYLWDHGVKNYATNAAYGTATGATLGGLGYLATKSPRAAAVLAALGGVGGIALRGKHEKLAAGEMPPGSSGNELPPGYLDAAINDNKIKKTPGFNLNDFVDLNNPAQSGAVGALSGAVLGGLAGLRRPSGERTPVADALLGAVGGGLIGVGTPYAVKAYNQVRSGTQGLSPEVIQKAKEEATKIAPITSSDQTPTSTALRSGVLAGVPAALGWGNAQRLKSRDIDKLMQSGLTLDQATEAFSRSRVPWYALKDHLSSMDPTPNVADGAKLDPTTIRNAIISKYRTGDSLIDDYVDSIRGLNEGAPDARAIGTFSKRLLLERLTGLSKDPTKAIVGGKNKKVEWLPSPLKPQMLDDAFNSTIMDEAAQKYHGVLPAGWKGRFMANPDGTGPVGKAVNSLGANWYALGKKSPTTRYGTKALAGLGALGGLYGASRLLRSNTNVDPQEMKQKVEELFSRVK